MTEFLSQRPSLSTKDTFDSPHLSGKLNKHGIAALQPNDDMDQKENEDPLVYDVADSNEHSLSASSEELEDYDAMPLDPDTIVDGSTGGIADIRRPSAGHNRHSNGHIRRRSEFAEGGPDTLTRRKSIQVRLEKTDQRGRYILTADDPEIKEILKKGIEREQAAVADSQRRMRIRDLVFTRQFTTFDRQNPLSAESPFHGFFTLFWLAMVLMFFKVAATNWRSYGSILGNNEVMKLMFSRDVMVLGITDLVMTCSSSFGFFLHKAIEKGYLTWGRSGWIIQNIWQTFFLAAVVGWINYRNWPWPHVIFMILHTMVFLMKQHSYSFYNGHLSGVYRRRNMLERKKQQLKEIEPIHSRPTSPAGPDQTPSSSIDFATSNAGMTHHRPSLGLRTSTNLTHEKSDVANVATAMASGQPLEVDQMQAFERIIQEEIDGLTKELKGKNISGNNAYPKNLTLKDFAGWSCIPTLVYELEYPRQDKINWWYVAEKTAATFGVIGVMMVISQAYIYPPVAETVRMKEAGMSLQERWLEIPWIASDMLFPLLLEQLLSWYLIWASRTPLSSHFCR